MERDQRTELLQTFFRQLFLAAKDSLEKGMWTAILSTPTYN